MRRSKTGSATNRFQVDFFNVNIDYPGRQTRSSAFGSARAKLRSQNISIGGDIEPVAEEDELSDEQIESRRARFSIISDGEDYIIDRKRNRSSRYNSKQGFRSKRARSSDISLPLVMESKEENYAELKKQFFF